MDMWPYVNGKALMNRVNLKEMEASDMLDVIHYLMEEDFHIVSEESMKSRSGIRTSLYMDLYGVKYKYEYVDPKKARSPYQHSYVPEDDTPDTSLGYMDESQAAKPFTPREMKPETIPYTPATKFDPEAANPFGGILDAPMGL